VVVDVRDSLRPVLDAIASRASPADLRQLAQELARPQAVAAQPPPPAVVQAVVDLQPVLNAISSRATVEDVQRVVENCNKSQSVVLDVHGNLQPVLDAIASRATAADLQKVIRESFLQCDVDLRPVIDAVHSRATAEDVRQAVEDFKRSLHLAVDMQPAIDAMRPVVDGLAAEVQRAAHGLDNRAVLAELKNMATSAEMQDVRQQLLLLLSQDSTSANVKFDQAMAAIQRRDQDAFSSLMSAIETSKQAVLTKVSPPTSPAAGSRSLHA